MVDKCIKILKILNQFHLLFKKNPQMTKTQIFLEFTCVIRLQSLSNNAFI